MPGTTDHIIDSPSGLPNDGLHDHQPQSVMINERILAHTTADSDLSLPPQQPAASFLKFGELPTEIRLMIWEAALPSRKLRPSACQGDSSIGDWSLPPPAHVSVCYEAREVAYRAGRKVPCSLDSPHIWTWFDRERDILDLTHFTATFKRPHDAIMSLAKEARTVILSEMCISFHWVRDLFQSNEFRKSIRSILVQVKRPRASTWTFWTPQHVTEVFGKENFVIVDVEKPKIPLWLASVLFTVTKSAKAEAQLRDLRPDAVTVLMDHQSGSWCLIHRAGDHEFVRRDTLRVWLSSGGDLASLLESCLHDDGSIDESKVRRCPQFASIPEIRLINTLELTHPALQRWNSFGGPLIFNANAHLPSYSYQAGDEVWDYGLIDAK